MTLEQEYFDLNMQVLKSNIDNFVDDRHANYCEVVSLLNSISYNTRRNIEEIMDESDEAKERRTLRYRANANSKLRLIELITKL